MDVNNNGGMIMLSYFSKNFEILVLHRLND